MRKKKKTCVKTDLIFFMGKKLNFKHCPIDFKLDFFFDTDSLLNQKRWSPYFGLLVHIYFTDKKKYVYGWVI